MRMILKEGIALSYRQRTGTGYVQSALRTIYVPSALTGCLLISRSNHV